MRYEVLVTTLVLTLITLSCGPTVSLHPLYTENELMVDPGLVGVWIDPGRNAEVLRFYEASGNSYNVIFTEGSRQVLLSGHLVNLGRYRFLDMFPQERQTYDFKFPVHTIFQIWRTADTLRIAFLENDWLRQMSEQKRLNLKHENIAGTVVLTAPTKQLQEFVMRHAENTEAFPDPGVLTRRLE